MPDIETERNACRIVLVENDPHYLMSFKQAVAEARERLHMEIELEQVQDGLATLYLISQYYLTEALPHAVVVDLDVLHCDVREFLSALRGHPLLRDLPVLVLTKSTSPSLHEEATQAGADRVFAKPVDSAALLRVATELIGAHCPAPPDRRHEKPARRMPELRDYIAAMNLIAKTTENFSCPPAYVNPIDEGDAYIWIEEMLERGKDGEETSERHAPLIDTLRLLFEAWCAGGTPEGEELRKQAKAAYERLSSEERELWEQQAAAR
jgi:CheY-like chemotaxis protein